jgi:hypothetical protein
MKLGVPLPISIQNDFSLLDRRFESQLAEACAPSNYNIGYVSFMRRWNFLSVLPQSFPKLCAIRSVLMLQAVALWAPGRRLVD